MNMINEILTSILGFDQRWRKSSFDLDRKYQQMDDNPFLINTNIDQQIFEDETKQTFVD